MKLKVCEVFRSIQGEGLRVGEPSLFVRLSGCNLHCEHCDTKYSWHGGEFVETSSLAERIISIGIPNLVITGGEPTLQAVSLLDLLKRVRKFASSITIETNGTLWNKSVIDVFNLIDLISLSPKLPSFAGSIQSLNSVCKILQRYPNKVCLKLVVSPGGYRELEGFLRDLWDRGVRVSQVFLQPDSTLANDLDGYIRLCAKLWAEVPEWQLRLRSLKVTLRFVPQLHRLLFWNVDRGV